MRLTIAMFLVALVLLGCKNNKDKTNKTTLTSEEKLIIQTLTDVDSLLAIDNGKFWNKKVYGPVLFVNPKTRKLYANENNIDSTFKKHASIYIDTLPKEINIANTAINWDGKRWSMLMLPLPSDKNSRNNLVIHEQFHRIQPEIGFDNLLEQNNIHLDMYKGRLLLKLELEALKKAVTSNTTEEQNKHLKNALIFRAERQSDKTKKDAENSLEINEGLAEYTAIMLSGWTSEELKTHFKNSIDVFYANPTFVRSFAYQTTPMYGYLLAKQMKNWQHKVSKETNLTDFFNTAFNITIPKNQNIEQIAKASNYNYDTILSTEEEREQKRLVKVEKLKSEFLKDSNLKLNFGNMNISFDPRSITPIEGVGTVYTTMRVTDNWGVLTVEKGALLDANWGFVIVTEPTSIEAKIVKGNGWTLELNPDYKVKKNNGMYELVKG